MFASCSKLRVFCLGSSNKLEFPELLVSVRAPDKKQKREEHEFEPFYRKKKGISFPCFVQRIYDEVQNIDEKKNEKESKREKQSEWK